MRVIKLYKFFQYIILIIFVFFVIEGSSFLAGQFLRKKGIFYKPTLGSNYEDYLARRDEMLGWPAPDNFGKDGYRDSTGSRIIPSFADPNKHKTLISLYGDSFAESGGVGHDQAWSNILSELLDDRVANYGVGGYGTDQAYLRFTRNTHDESTIVILAHTSEDILRNVNQFRGLFYDTDIYGLKPRFIIDENDNLKLVPLPNVSMEEYAEFVYNPEEYLKYEYFIPNGQSGVQILKFPYTLSILKLFRHYHIRAKLSAKPRHLDFYQHDHSSNSLRITTEIIIRFYNEAHNRGKIPIVIIIPIEDDLLFYKDKKIWTYQNLIDNLRDNGIVYLINAGDSIMKYIGNSDTRNLFDKRRAHYNEIGYKILAMAVYDYLKEKRLLEYFHSG